MMPRKVKKKATHGKSITEDIHNLHLIWRWSNRCRRWEDNIGSSGSVINSIRSKKFCWNWQKLQKTLRVVTITMICSTLASLWKFQYFWRPICNPVEHLLWSFYCENSKPLSIFTKISIKDARLGSKYASAFWKLLKRFVTLKYFIS